MTDKLFGLDGQTLEGKYVIDRVVAEGGFGVVYKALHKTLKKAVAVKVLKVPADFSPTAREVFLRGFETEAQTIARLEHPAIVKVLDFGVSPMPAGGEAPWMVLEWLTGRTLEDDLKARHGQGGRGPQECLELLRSVIEAVAVAHEGGVAHRDIKPANVMLTGPRENLSASVSGVSRRGAVQARLLDFGIAKIMLPDETGTSGETRTKAAMLAFSLRYAAPEQVSATRTGPWTDVHALGLVLTEMLIDRRVYEGADSMEVHMQVLGSVRPTPAKFGVGVGAWEAVLQKALAVRPGDRFQSAGALLDALEQSLPGAVHQGAAAGAGSLEHASSTVVTAPPSSTLTPVVNSSHPPAAPSRRHGLVLLGAAISTVVVGTLAVGAYALIGPGHAAQPATATSSHASVAAPAAVVAPRAPAVAAVPPAAPALVAPAAPPAPVVAAPVADDEAPVGGHGHRPHHGHGSHADEGQSPTVFAPAAMGSAAPPVLVTPE